MKKCILIKCNRLKFERDMHGRRIYERGTKGSKESI